jgi:capsular polysaccharide biosynthesis protein
VLERVLTELNLGLSIESLRSNLVVNSESNTEIIRITIEDESPLQARDIANALALVFQQEVRDILFMDNVQIIDAAKIPQSPIRPQPMLNILIAGFLGVMAGLGLVFLIEYLDNTIKTPEDVQRYLDLPILGAIPSFDE